MQKSEEFFIRECAAHARSLPISEAIEYLRGLFLVCPKVGDLEPLNKIYNALMVSDNQLDLIHAGQMKLQFEKGRKK